MKKFRNITILLAITSALIGGTAMTAQAAEDDGGMPGQTQGDDGAGGIVLPGTSNGENGGGTYSDGSDEGDYGDGGAGYGDTNGGTTSSTLGTVPASMATYYMAVGYYDGAYVYEPGVNGILPTQGDLEQFNAAKGGSCIIAPTELTIDCSN